MADHPRLSGDCQCISDCQGYSDKGGGGGGKEYTWLTIHGCPGTVRVSLTVRDTLTRGGKEYTWLTIRGCPGTVRVSLTVRDTLTRG